MKKFLNTEEFLRRKRLIAAYLQGLETGDADLTAAVWLAAETDAELARILDEINYDYESEMALAPFAEAAKLVGDLARESFASASEETKSERKFLTLSDVAKQMEAKGNLAMADEAANKKLLAANVPLTKFSLPEIKRAAESLKIKASESFWRIFHKTAILLEMKHGHEQALQAAREKKIRRRNKEADERKQETRNK